MSDSFQQLRDEFWRTHAIASVYDECYLDYQSRLAIYSRDRSETRPTSSELASFVDEYNPHGAYHYGGSLPLTPLQQVSILWVACFFLTCPRRQLFS
jgi:hypothetical protein